MKSGLSIQLNCHPRLKYDFFYVVVFAATVSMPCIHIRHLKLHVSWKFSTYFSSRMEAPVLLTCREGYVYFSQNAQFLQK